MDHIAQKHDHQRREHQQHSNRVKKDGRGVHEVRNLLQGDNHNRGYDDVQQGEREEHFPTQPHHLIVAKSRHTPTQQNLQPAEKQDFERNRRYLQRDNREVGEQYFFSPRKVKPLGHEIGNLPAAEEQRRHETSGCDDLGELTGKEHQKLTAGVFHVITGNQFRIALRQVKRDPFGFSNRGSEKE